MATNKPETQSRSRKVETLAKRIMRISAALQFMYEGAEAISGEGNEPIPGLMGAGFAATCQWAAVELEKLAEELPSGGAR